MVLEACVIIIDNSEWTRNGDYSPSRLEAAKEAANYLANRKLSINVENCVSIMTLGGSNAKCLLSLTSEQGKVTNAIGLIQHEDGFNFESSLQVAQVKLIVLKHRQNSNQKQRIIAFVASPLSTPASATNLLEIGKKLKKNGISLDIIDFGTENRENREIFEKLVEITESEAQPSRLITVEPQPHLILLDALLSMSPELFNRETGGSSSGMGGGSGNDFEFGVDPEMDPELAMALKLSMEEELSRQQKSTTAAVTDENENYEEEEESYEDENEDENEDEDMESEAEHNGEDDDEDEEDEDMLLAKAIALSMEQEQKQEHEEHHPKQE